MGAVLRFGLDLRGKIILVLLIVGALSALGISWLGFQNGRSSLIERITEQIEGRRDISGSQVASYLSTARDHVVAMSADITLREVLRELPAAATRLNRILPPEGTEEGLTNWYSSEFIPKLDASMGDIDPRSFLPGNYSARILQGLYVSNTLDPSLVPEAQFYSELHDRIDPSMRGTAQALGYEDIFLIGPGGRVLYSVLKEPDFATDLENGLYSESGLARVFEAVRAEREVRSAIIEDYSFYRPSADVPAIFLGAPVYDGGLFLGYVAVQLSAERIGSPVQDSSGLGASGEVYIVGADRRLRTEPRLFRENPEAFSAMLSEQGYPQSRVREVERNRTPIKVLEISGPAVDAGLRGETGTTRMERNYRGEATLASYRPLEIPGLDWVIVSEMPLDEALAPVRSLGFQMMVTAAVLSLGITFFSMWAARALTRPVQTLISQANAALAGKKGIEIAMDRGDEYGELSHAMQGLVDARDAAEALARTRELRSEQLLSRFLPDAVAREMTRRDLDQSGEFNLVEHVPAVAVVYAEILGYHTLMTSRPAEEAVLLLDNLIKLFDDAALRTGVEKVRTVGEFYVAAAGLSSPQIDHAQRAIAFAEAIRDAARRFAAEFQIDVSIRAGIASGAAVSGVVGRDKLSFELLGAPKFDAIALCSAGGPDEIRLTEAVRELASRSVVPAVEGPGLILSTAAE